MTDPANLNRRPRPSLADGLFFVAGYFLAFGPFVLGALN